MADSDDEYSDKKRRDKFRRERSDYSNERRRSDHDRRWRDDYGDGRKKPREDDDERGGGRYHHGGSPRRGGDWSPPSKRYRRDGWESLRDYGGHGMMPGTFMMDRRPHPWMMGGDLPHGGMPPGARGDMMTGFHSMSDSRHRGSTLLTFKQFLSQQDDNIDDTEAIKLYHNYKADFRKKQLHQFFNDHKEEDWLQAKYHPARIVENRAKYLKNVKKRLDVFEWLQERAEFDSVSFEVVKDDALIRVMDKAVILMEGGDENDFKALDIPLKVSTPTKDTSPDTKKPKEEVKEVKSEDSKSSFDSPTDLTPEQQLLADQAKEYSKMEDGIDDRVDETSNNITAEDNVGDRKRPRESDDVQNDDNIDETEPTKAQKTSTDDSPVLPEGDPLDTGVPPPPPPIPEDPPMLEDTPTKDHGEAEPETGQAETSPETPEEAPNDEDNHKPRHLHITKAVYVRHIPPKLSAADILEVGQTIPGYLRLAFADPQPDKGYERRGWITYTAETNVLDVAARISAAKIQGVQLNCQVNKELSRRVKSVPSIMWSRGVVIHNINQLLNVIEVFDKKGELWQFEKIPVPQVEVEEDGETPMETIDEPRPSPKTNPLIEPSQSILRTTKLTATTNDTTSPKSTTEEGEEEEEGVIKDPNTEVLSTESPLIKMLDQLLWYVRVVHSLDFYNFTHFPEEDLMPHRCAIVSVRAKPPNSVTSEEVSEHIKHIDEKIVPLLVEKKELDDEEMEKLGKRDEETELEKFIDANTQKLGENRYLCPLSGKKFRGPDFVRKHIFNKHQKALDEVKSDTEYFNNYLKDPDRPMPLDGSAVISEGDHFHGRDDGHISHRSHDTGSRYDHRGPRGGRRYMRPRGGGYGGNRGVSGRRRLNHYEDLDAPVDMY